jgi:hypothetical protein
MLRGDWKRVLLETEVEEEQGMIEELRFVVVVRTRSGLEDQQNLLNCHMN